jgi:hypothetical protein
MQCRPWWVRCDAVEYKRFAEDTSQTNSGSILVRVVRSTIAVVSVSHPPPLLLLLHQQQQQQLDDDTGDDVWSGGGEQQWRMVVCCGGAVGCCCCCCIRSCFGRSDVVIVMMNVNVVVNDSGGCRVILMTVQYVCQPINVRCCSSSSWSIFVEPMRNYYHWWGCIKWKCIQRSVLSLSRLRRAPGRSCDYIVGSYLIDVKCFWIFDVPTIIFLSHPRVVLSRGPWPSCAYIVAS